LDKIKKTQASATESEPVSGVIPASDVSRLVKAVSILTLSTVISLIAALLSIYGVVSSKTVAIAVDARGVVVPIVPLTEPLLSESRVLGFVDECLRRSFSHDFLHYESTIPQAQECFTANSAERYALSIQPYIKIMESKRMVMSITIPRAPRVVRAYKKVTALGEVIHWDVQAQIEINFEGRSERIPGTKSTVQITVKRVPLEGTPRGILIDSFSVGAT
jgi:intracellular multiplication protein IcmL